MCAVAGAPGRSWPCAGALPFRFRLRARARHFGASVFGWRVDGCRFCIRWPKVGSIRLDSRVAKLESKINYKAKPAMCALVRDAQRSECCGRYEVDAVRYLPADAGAVWRYEVTWAGDLQCAPELQIFDTHMNAIDVTVHVFESQVDVPQRNGCRVNKTYLSVEMPQDIRDFVAIVSDPTEQIQSGFCAMDGRLYNGMLDDSWNRMKDARADDALIDVGLSNIAQSRAIWRANVSLRRPLPIGRS